MPPPPPMRVDATHGSTDSGSDEEIGEAEVQDPALPSMRSLVVGAAALMICAQLGFRAWALYPSWFYTDDYRLLAEADGRAMNWTYLSSPFDNQFMPLGRAIAWLVAHAGHVNWGLAASLSLVAQLLASTVCLWMLTTLFGHRWAILAPLGLFLSLSITMPALMWWAASLNQLPLQVVFFASVATWTRYLRERRWRWLATTMALLGVGLLAYVKTLLIFGVLAFLLLAYFSSGRPVARVLQVLRRYWPAAVAAVALAVSFGVYYAAHVPQIFSSSDTPVAGDLADRMIGTALSTGALGGPWRWDSSNPPVGLADPPAWTVHLAWALLAVGASAVALRRRRTGRAWLLLASYVAAAYVLLLTSRAPVVGSAIGLEYRYLTDVVPVLALCLGLASMRLLGAVEASEARHEPLLTRLPGPRWQVALVVVVCLSGLVSSRSYALTWHHNNPGESYLHTAMNGLRHHGTVDLADQTVPNDVVPSFSISNNTTRRLLPLTTDAVRFPDSTDDLVVLDDTGAPHHALIDATATGATRPKGACGWKVPGTGRTIPLSTTTYDLPWWIRIGYLGAAQDTLQVRAGMTTTEVPVHRGLHNVYVRVTGEVSSVTLTGLAPDNMLCVDTVEVGHPVPGAAL